jgi:SAM-dependent methyltransferase
MGEPAALPMTADLEGLDHAFLRWLPVVADDQKAFQRLYVAFFDGCDKVVDLGCGEGNFVELLEEHGIRAIGVDSDPDCYQAARDRGVNVVHQDALKFLRDQEAESVDGIFAAHLVEHLPYEQVIELLRGASRALKPNGVIVLTTPNVRGLYSHLEMFYLHFGHVTFYHPRLLCFFLEYAGFAEPKSGVNTTELQPLLGDEIAELAGIAGAGPTYTPTAPLDAFDYERLLPEPDSLLRRLIWHGKMWLVRMIVQPYLDQFVAAINLQIRQTNAAFREVETRRSDLDAKLVDGLNLTGAVLDRLDQPFEAYATARKPGNTQVPADDAK